MKSFILPLLFVNFCLSIQLPSYFQKCDRRQSDFNDCLSKAVKNSLNELRTPKPEVNLPTMEPLVISAVSIQAGTKAVNFNQNYKNVRLIKLTHPLSLKVNMDFDKKEMALDIQYAEVIMDFEYEINGNILMLPISGKGPGVITIDNPKMTLAFSLEEYDKKGKKYYKVVNTKMDFYKIDGLHVKYDNLFNGDKALGDNINKVINDNWKQIFDDVKSGYEDAAAVVLNAIFNGFLTKVSIAELFGGA